MDKVNTAAKTGNFTTNNSEDRKLGESYAANLMEQEQISSDKAKTQQDIDTYSNQVSYAEQNAGTINRNLNEPFLQEIMARHPELNSKEQALRWSKSHQPESEQIAKSVISQNNPFESADYKAHVQKLENSSPSAKSTQIASPSTLESRHNINANKVQEQAIVQDVTGVQKPLKEVVTNAAQTADLGYNSNVKNILQSNLRPEEKVIAKNLEIERNQVDSSKTKETKEKINKESVKLKGIVGESTIARVLDKIGNDASDIIGIDKVGDKKNNGK
jgi:lambda repressor-like predicted transcriptional regulator